MQQTQGTATFSGVTSTDVVRGNKLPKWKVTLIHLALALKGWARRGIAWR